MPTPTSKILLTEDDEFLSSLIKNRLEKEGFEVRIAKDGDEVLAILKTYQPDLILLDIILPHKLGFEVLEELQNNPSLKKAPVMVLSNLGQESDIEKVRQFGVRDYYIKARTSVDDLIKMFKAIVSRGPREVSAQQT